LLHLIVFHLVLTQSVCFAFKQLEMSFQQSIGGGVSVIFGVSLSQYCSCSSNTVLKVDLHKQIIILNPWAVRRPQPTHK